MEYTTDMTQELWTVVCRADLGTGDANYNVPVIDPVDDDDAAAQVQRFFTLKSFTGEFENLQTSKIKIKKVSTIIGGVLETYLVPIQDPQNAADEDDAVQYFIAYKAYLASL